MIGPCAYDCNNKNDFGYCRSSGCVNSNRNGGYWIDEPVYRQTMDGKTWDGFTYCSECKEVHEYGYR